MALDDLNFDDLLPPDQKRPAQNATAPSIASLSFDDLIPKNDYMRGPQGVAADTGALQAMTIGAGRGMDQLGAGIRQALYGLGDKLGFSDATAKQAELAQQQQENARLFQPLQQAHPLATGVGEALPSFAVPVGGAASVLGAAGRMALPGILQGLTSYGSLEDRLKDAALQGGGGAAGGALGSVVGKVISPAVGAAARAADPALERMAQIARDAGIQLTPAQAGGGKFAQGVQSALDTIPWTAGGQQGVKDAQQAAFGKQFMQQAVGADASKATPDVLAQAASDIGQKFEQGYTGVTVPLNQSTMKQVDLVATKYASRLDAMQRPVVANIADDLKAAGNAGGFLTGDQYHAVVSDIAGAARNVSDTQTKTALLGLRGALDASFRNAAPADQAATYFEARGQWKNLLTIEDAMKNSRSQGDLPAKQLYASMQKATPGFVRGGGGDLGDTVRMGRQFLPDPIANSGTPFRNAFTNLLTAGTMGGLGAGGSALSGGDPMQGLQMGLGGYLLSKGAQRAYNSGYPTNQWLSEEAKRMLMRGGGLLGAGAGAAAAGSP